MASHSPEKRAFRKHYSELLQTIRSPITLAAKLYSAEILSRETRDRINELVLTTEKTSELLAAAEISIWLEAKTFDTFLTTLEEDDSLYKGLCDKLRSTRDQIKSENSRTPIVPLPPRTTMVDFISAQWIDSQSNTRRSSTSPPPSKSAKTMHESSFSSDTYSTCSDKRAVIRAQYRQFLQDCYRQPLPDDDKLLNTASKHYIKLAIISKKDVTRKQADEFTRKSLHGLTDEILCEKAPIELNDILKHREDGTPVRCVLIEGAPGIGKSTLAWEVCHKWEELENVKDYDLVILVRLREKKAQEACCLKDLLPSNRTTNKNELLDAIGRGKGVLIVCDGFDELPYRQRQKDSVYIELIKGMLLPEATVIVTSRPSVSGNLWSICQHNIHRHLEILGFTRKDIERFAESVFSGGILAEFLSYITSNPPIHGMMYVPLNAVIVALIYQESYDIEKPYPTTITQLYDRLTRAIIRRHLVSTSQVPGNYRMPRTLQQIKEIRRLPPLVVKQLFQLAELAYVGLKSKVFVFTNLGEDFEHLSMLKKTTALNVCTGPECSYSFLHLTLQEYLAALYFAVKNVLYYKKSLGRNIVRFLAGICSNNDYHDQSVFKELVNLLAENRTRDGLWIVLCAYECPNILNSYGLKMCFGVKNDSIDVEPAVGFDWYITGYCISHFNRGWDLTIVIDHLNEDNFDLFKKGLQSSLVAEGKIRSLLTSVPLSQIIPPLREFYQLYRLHLHCVNVNEDDEEVLRQLIAPGSGLNKLVYYVSQTTEYTDTLIPLIFQQSSLEELILTNSANEPPHILEERKTRNLKLSHSNTNLDVLTIAGTGFLRPLAALILNISSLFSLEVADQVYSDLPIITSIVQTCHMLESLTIGRMNDYNASTNQTIFFELFDAVENSQIQLFWIKQDLPPHVLERYKRIASSVS